MRVVLLTQTLNVGGAERQVVALACGLLRRGHEVTVAPFYDGGPLETGLHRGQVPVARLGKRGRWDVPAFLWRLSRLLRERRPDVVYAFLPVPNLLAALLRPVMRRSRVAWGVRASDMDLSRYDRVTGLTYRLEAWLSRLADLVIANSESGKAHALRCGFPAAALRVVPNGIDVAAFRPDARLRQETRRALGLEDGQQAIGIVARLDPMKDHDTFLRAAALLAAENSSLRFVVVGDGPVGRAERLRTLAEALGLADRIAWAGRRDDVAALYNAFDVACLSSAFGEGFPNVVGEAMACGTPCAVTAVGDAPLVVGDTGEVAPPRDPAALAGAVRRLLGRLDAQGDILRDACRRRIVDHFSLETMVTHTEALLADMCAARP